MNIFVFSDESGVFDHLHNSVFVFGGVVFFSKEEKDVATRKYIHAERVLRGSAQYANLPELKATALNLSSRGKMFRTMSRYQRFGIIIHQERLLARIFQSKKDKQRYLDYAYKIGLKRLFEGLIEKGKIVPEEVKNITVCVDEHTTATNGRYELREALEQEFKHGTYNATYSRYFPPIFNHLNKVSVSFLNSENVPLIRAADMIANRIYYLARSPLEDVHKLHGVFLIEFP